MLSVTTASAQVGIVYRTYDLNTDSLGVGTGTTFDTQAQSIINEEFARVNRAAPRNAGMGTEIAFPAAGERLFEIHGLEADEYFIYVETHEATYYPANDSLPSGYLVWHELVHQDSTVLEGTRELFLRRTAVGILAQLGWLVPTEPPPLPADSFYVYGANPNTTGTVRVNVPPGWEVRWVDTLGRVISVSDEITNLPSGVYFAVGTTKATRERQVRRVTVIR